MFINYYEILDISQDATADEVTSAYRSRSKDVHPDVNQSPDAEAAMKNLNAAYETLSDSSKRARYDRQLEEEVKAAEERKRRNSPEVYIDYIGDELRERLGNMFGYRVNRRTGYHTYLAEIHTNFHAPDGHPITIRAELNTENQAVWLLENDTIPKVIDRNRSVSGGRRNSVDQLELEYRQVFRDALRIYGVGAEFQSLSLRIGCDSLEAVPDSLFKLVQAIQYISGKADLAGKEAKGLEELFRAEMPELLGSLFSYRLDEDGHLEVTTSANMPNGQKIRLWWIPATDESNLPKLTDWGETYRAVVEHNEKNLSDRDRLIWKEANDIYGTETESLNDKEETLTIIREVPDGNIADSVLCMMQPISYIASRVMETHDPQYYIDRGERKRKAWKVDEAISDFDKAIELDPSNTSAYCHRGRTYLGQNLHGKAIKDLDTALRIDDKCEWAFRLRATVNERLGKDVDAIDDWTQSIKLRPRNAASYYWRGLRYSSVDRMEEAMQDLDAAITIDDKHLQSYRLRARIKEQQGCSEEAIDDLSAVIRLGPTHFDHAKRGLLYSELAKYEEAIVDFESAWKMRPEIEYYKERIKENRELLRKQKQQVDDNRGQANTGDEARSQCPRRSRLDILEGCRKPEVPRPSNGVTMSEPFQASLLGD